VDVFQDLPLETGTVTAYAVSSALPYWPTVATESLWRTAQQDLNGDGLAELLNPRFGFADAFNFDIAGAAPLAASDAKRTSGPWVDLTGFAIDHGPALLLIDNYLGGAYDGAVDEELIPKLFMSAPHIHGALVQLFPDWPDIPSIVSWSSAVTYGTAGEALLEIADDGTFCEPRNAGIQRLVVQFSKVINPATFTSSSVQIAGHNINGDDVDLGGVIISTSTRNGDIAGVIDFSQALPNAARYVVRIQGVTDVVGNPLAGDNDRIIVALIGDVSGDSAVNPIDVNLLDSVLRTTVPPTDARYDLNGDAKVDLADMTGLVVDTIGTSMADTNLDYKVNILDLGNLANRYGQAGSFCDGDANCDGILNILDLGDLANDYGKTYPVPVGALADAAAPGAAELGLPAVGTESDITATASRLARAKGEILRFAQNDNSAAAPAMREQGPVWEAASLQSTIENRQSKMPLILRFAQNDSSPGAQPRRFGPPLRAVRGESATGSTADGPAFSSVRTAGPRSLRRFSVEDSLVVPLDLFELLQTAGMMGIPCP